MRVLVVHHGRIAENEPMTGGALRARTHAVALAGSGHVVTTLAREQDVADGFRSPGDLRRLARANAPDWILCVAPEEAPALRGIAPLVVDLYAPRLLEAAFEDLQREEAGRALRAVQSADQVLFSNPRQRWFWMGILGVCGWDSAEPVGLVVPLAAPRSEHPRRLPKRPVFIAGGQPWPWQNQQLALERAAHHLGKRGEVHTYGLPAVEGVRGHPLASREDWLSACADATAALDRFAPNPERALAMSFRQADYLSTGLPLITDADTPLGNEVRETTAGWVNESLEDALDAAIAAPRSSSELAERYRPERTEAPLLDWSPRARSRAWSLLTGSGRIAAAEAQAAIDRARREAAEAEVAGKKVEIEALNLQVRALSGSVEALSVAIADVAGFRREAVQVLGTRIAGEETRTEHLARELEIARADLAKKNAEIEAVTADRNRLGAWLRGR